MDAVGVDSTGECWYCRIMLRAELIGTATETSAEVLHAMNLETDRCLDEVAALQLLNHDLN